MLTIPARERKAMNGAGRVSSVARGEKAAAVIKQPTDSPTRTAQIYSSGPGTLRLKYADTPPEITNRPSSMGQGRLCLSQKVGV